MEKLLFIFLINFMPFFLGATITTVNLRSGSKIKISYVPKSIKVFKITQESQEPIIIYESGVFDTYLVHILFEEYEILKITIERFEELGQPKIKKNIYIKLETNETTEVTIDESIGS